MEIHLQWRFIAGKIMGRYGKIMGRYGKSWENQLEIGEIVQGQEIPKFILVKPLHLWLYKQLFLDLSIALDT